MYSKIRKEIMSKLENMFIAACVFFICPSIFGMDLDVIKPLTYYVEIPNGYIYTKIGSKDSEMGNFICQNTKSVINGDIGMMAGITLRDQEEMIPKDTTILLKISGSSFPKKLTASVMERNLVNCGHFDMVATSEGDVSNFLSLVSSFKFTK